MKYQRFEAEDVAEILRHEFEARQAEKRAEQAALSAELIGPYKMTWEFWKVLFDRRDVKALTDFEATSEFQGAVQHCIRALETSPLWAKRPERGTLLEQYRNRLVLQVKGDPEPGADVQQGNERLDVQDGQGSNTEYPEGRQRLQEGRILGALKDMGYDPMQLPRSPAGTPGPKADVRSRLADMTGKVFNKAWQRLRDFGEIADAK